MKHTCVHQHWSQAILSGSLVRAGASQKTLRFMFTSRRFPIGCLSSHARMRPSKSITAEVSPAGAPHRPSSRPVEVLKLCPVVKRKCSNVHRFLDPFHKAVLIVEHAVGIAPLNL